MVLGLVNGMIGSGFLILPVVGISAGWFTTIWVTILVGYMAYYTAYLVVVHLGKARNIKDSFLAHFKYDYIYVRGYSFLIWLSFIPFLLGYFRLICMQIIGLLGYSSHLIGPIVAIVLLLAVLCIRSCHIWE